jgi:hypothetical protein
MLVPPLRELPYNCAAAQVASDQVALGCALERYRHTQKHYPETLDALVPGFIAALPRDLITGEPYKYFRTDGTHFVLYSIGWDNKDNGGTPGPASFDQAQGDWVWRYNQQ